MANEYSADVPKGFNVPKQIRLDSITGVQNELTLKNLGSGNNLAFKYYDGLKVYCKDEKTEYIWREVVGLEEGLLDTNFTYPTYPAIDGIDYSGKTYNFFLISNSNITPPDGSETKLIEGTNVTITGTGTTLNPYEISADSQISQTYINEGGNINITGNGTQLTPYIINADLTDLGIVKTIDNEVIAPGQTLSIINNELTGKVLTTKEYVQSIIPNTTDGSETKLEAGDNITILGIGTTLNPYIINTTGVQSVTGTIVDNSDPLNPIVNLPEFKTIKGESIIGTGDIEIDNLQKVITYPTDFTGTNYTITNNDYNYVIFVNNGIVDVSITIDSSVNIPNFSVGFIQEGTGTVTHLTSGVTLINIVGYKIKGQGYQTFIEKKLNTNIYYLLGNVKV